MVAGIKMLAVSKRLKMEEIKKLLVKESDRTSQVRIISEYILEKKKIHTAKKALSGKAIHEEWKNMTAENDELPNVPLNTFNIYISKVANSPDSKINCEGRKKGYYIDKVYEKIEEKNEKNKKEEEEVKAEIKESKEKGYILEKDLYPILEDWLFQVDNERVKDVSSNRKQGKWGNPDLIGIKVDNLFGATEVELTSIEAKITNENWQQWIFESVAHTIFSNRSYFAFIHSENHINKIEPELKHYAESYKVGILIIAVDEKDFLDIKNKSPFVFTEDNYRILEYAPAPFNNPHIKFKKKFLKGLGIDEQKDLYNFGKGLK